MLGCGGATKTLLSYPMAFEPYLLVSFEMCTENVWMYCLWITSYRKPLLPKIKMMLKWLLLSLLGRIDDLLMEKLFPIGNEMIQSQIFANVFRGNHRDHHWNCYCVTHHPRSNCLWSHRFCMVRNSVFSIITLCHSLLHGCRGNGIYLWWIRLLNENIVKNLFDI